MSRVAKKVIDIPTGVTITVASDAVTVKGAKGSLSLPMVAGVGLGMAYNHGLSPVAFSAVLKLTMFP